MVSGGVHTMTGTYVTQFKVTFAQAGIGTDTGTNTVLTEPSPGGNSWSKSQLDGGAVYEWVTDGQSISFAYTTNVDASPGSGERRVREGGRDRGAPNR